MNEEQREEKVLRRGWERDQRLRGGESGSSEDVWRQRRRLRPGMFGERWVEGVGEEEDEEFDLGDGEEGESLR